MSQLSLLLAVLATWFGKDVPTRTGNAYHLQPYQAKLDNNLHHLATVFNRTRMEFVL
jgi:hypothetical protein